MRLITKSEKIKDVAQRFKMSWVGPVREITDIGLKEQYGKLLALNPPTVESVEAIIGDNTFTSNTCDECKSDCDLLIGFEMRYPSEESEDRFTTLCLCQNCLDKALTTLKLIKGEKA